MAEQRAISIRQPWAWLIVHGHKPVENRTWRANYRGPVLIHAGKVWDKGARAPNGLRWPESIIGIPEESGGIIGTADLVDCVTSHPSPWFTGPFGFVMANPRPLSFRPLKGALGIFRVTDG